MSRISELELAIKDLRNAASTIKDVADTLAEIFSTTVADEVHDAAVPAEPVLTLEQVRAVLADKARMGFTAEIRTLLQKLRIMTAVGIRSHPIINIWNPIIPQKHFCMTIPWRNRICALPSTA